MITEQEIADWFKDHKLAETYAAILYQRFCEEPPRQYRYLARELNLRGASQARHHENAALQRLRIQPISREKVEQAAPRVPQALWAALFGHWRPREVPK